LSDEEKEKLIRILLDAKEENNVQRGLLYADLTRAKQEFELAVSQGNKINEALYILTGNHFYRKKYGEGENGH
jgi:hypothetical protein